MTTDASTDSPLRAMHERIKALDPLSGPNVMRHAKAHLKDNGNGTMTYRSPRPYKPNPPKE